MKHLLIVLIDNKRRRLSDVKPSSSQRHSAFNSDSDGDSGWMSNGEDCSLDTKWTHFSPKSLKVLEKWFNNHKDNPYPKRSEKTMLAKLTDHSILQVIILHIYMHTFFWSIHISFF